MQMSYCIELTLLNVCAVLRSSSATPTPSAAPPQPPVAVGDEQLAAAAEVVRQNYAAD
jgi:hypothetical protein